MYNGMVDFRFIKFTWKRNLKLIEMAQMKVEEKTQI